MKQIVFLLLLFTNFSVSGVEVAPRISDREIIESLAELKAGQKTMNQRFDQMESSIDQRFDQMESSIDQRFDQMGSSIDQRFEQVESSIDQRFKSVDQRFVQIQNTMDQRFGQLHGTMVSMFSVLGALIIALFGYMVWDRRTAFKPFAERFNALEKDLIIDLQLRNENGSLLTRLTQALRKLAHDDPQVASVLKSFSLL